MDTSIRKKFFSGIAWTFIENVLVKSISFVFTVILARLLTPDDYGMIGMLSIFIAISQVFISSGFSDALIQKSNITETDYSTAFYFNFFISVLAYLTLFISAPLIATFYDEPELSNLLRILALTIVLGAFNLVQRAKLTKEMRFRPIAIISLTTTLVGGIIGVFLAYRGMGPWALVCQTVFSTFISVFLYPMLNKWVPKALFSFNALKHLWGYGSKLIVTGLLSVIILNLSNILIGRFYRRAQVGYFTRAQGLGDLPSSILYSVFSSVSFPVFCQYHDDSARLMQLYKKILFHIVLITCPIIIGLIILSRPLVVVLLTEKWLPCVPLLQFFLLARMFLPIGSTHTSLLRSTGRTDIYMKLYFLTGPLSLFAIVMAIPFGVKAMAFATFVAAFISYVINSYLIGRLYGYGLICQLRDWKLVIISNAIMAMCMIALMSVISDSFLQLIIVGSFGALVYLLCCYFFKLSDEDVICLMKSRIGLKL